MGSMQLFAAVATDQGLREYMEDTHVVDRDLRMVAVFDGHGGGEVSDYCAKHASHHVRQALGIAPPSADDGGGRAAEAALAANAKRVPDALSKAFASLDRAADQNVPNRHAGCTACIALCGRDDVWVANAGDSRAIMCVDGIVTPMSHDHTPELPGERARIVGNGGSVIYDGHGSHRINGTLNVSRAIGDWHLRTLVVPTPDVSHARRPKGPFKRAFMVLASDGLWDAYSSEELGLTVNTMLEGGATVQQAIEGVVRGAARRGSADNITAAYVSIFRP